MVKLASLFFILFCTVSPKLLLNNNNNSSSMDMEASPTISPMVLFKSTTLPTKTSSFSTKLNPLQIKSELPIFIEPLPVFSGIGPAAVSLMDLEVNPTMVLILVTIVLLLGLILLLVLHFRSEFRDDESKKEVLRGKGRDWRLLKAVDATSHCVSPDILTGYRPALDYVGCLFSILRVHNEIVNIW